MYRIAVLIPCYDEEAAIGSVIQAFRSALPEALVYVFDNNSTDDTVQAARQAGAVVRHEKLQGKGNVVRRMFADVQADIYILVDGDDTYEASAAPEMVRMLVENQLDMVTARRVSDSKGAYRPGHRLGNVLLTGLVALIFGNRVTDMLSGYRVFSRRFVKSFPALAVGFEIETEFTVHALELNMPLGELDTIYKERPAGSTSKLRTWSDGLKILRTIILLLKEERPLLFFGTAGLLLFLLGVGLSVPVIMTYMRTGLVPRLPTALLSVALVLLAFLSSLCGLVLDSVSHSRKETKRLAYLTIPAVEAPDSPPSR